MFNLSDDLHTLSDACKLQRIRLQFVSLCHHRFCSHIDYSYVMFSINLLEITYLKCSEAFPKCFFNGCFQWFKYCPTILETVGLRVPNRNFRELVCLTLSLLMSYIYGSPCKARNLNVVYMWTYVWQRWKPSLSICCTMFQHWINVENYPVAQLCINTLPATKVTLITDGI
jgi:hypothetical protein